MSDIIVTTPKDRMKAAALEADACRKDGAGFYFRRLCGVDCKGPSIEPGERVYYVEDDRLRGFCILDRLEQKTLEMVCASSGERFFPGLYAFMDATTWTWIKPFLMRGFRGWRYMPKWKGALVEIVGGWLDPRPEVREAGTMG